MKTCAICGRRVVFMQDDICKTCYITWGRDDDWVKALIKIHKHDYYMSCKNREVCFTDDYRDINGEKLADFVEI